MRKRSTQSSQRSRHEERIRFAGFCSAGGHDCGHHGGVVITSIRWDKMFASTWGHFDLEGILPIGGHLYVVGTTWAMVNPPWVRCFPYTEFREGVTGGLVYPGKSSAASSQRGLVLPFEEHMSRKEYIRQNTCEPVERVEDEPKPSRMFDRYRYPIHSRHGSRGIQGV